MNLIDKFVSNVQLALHLHEAGRPGLLSQEDYHQLESLNHGLSGWNLYKNSMGETHLGSPDGDHIKIDPTGEITVFGPEMARRR